MKLSKNMMMVYEGIGWIGTVLIVVAYFLVSNAMVDGASLIYQTMNVLGALFLGISLVVKKAWPALGLQVVWFIIGGWAILSVLFLGG